MKTPRPAALLATGVLALGLCAGAVDTAAAGAITAPIAVTNAGTLTEGGAPAAGSLQDGKHESSTTGKHKKKHHRKKHQNPGTGTDSPALPDAGTPPGTVPGGGSPNTTSSPGGGTPGTDPPHPATPPPHSGPGGVKPLTPSGSA